MATRFYPTTTAAAISPTFDSGWEVSGGAVRQALDTVNTSVYNTSVIYAGSGVANDDTLVMQAISAPLERQDISGTIKGQIRAREVSGLVDGRAQVKVRVVSQDGTTVRGTLLDYDVAVLANEFVIDASTPRNAQFPRGGATSLTQVSAERGDRIVIEVGFRNHGTDTSQVRFNFSGAAVADLPEDETTTTAGWAWFEFSQSLLFQPTTVKTFAASGSWICPPGVTAVQVEAWGGGGSGGGSTTNNGGGGGGAGGQYAKGNAVTVVPGTTYTVTVAATKTGTTGAGTAGNDSIFGSNLVVAKGGALGAAGSAGTAAGGTGSSASGVGDTVNAGGSGSAGVASTRSGGGGGGAGSGGAGGSTTASTTGGTGTATGGGNGGTGLAAGSNAAGGNGNTFGGGGAGAYRTATTSRAGGNGAAGQIILTYTTPLASYLVDTFGETTLDTTKWFNGSFTGGTQSVSGGSLTLTPATSTLNTGAEIDTNDKYDFTGNGVYVNVTTVALQNASTNVKVVLDSNNSVYFSYVSGNLIATKQIANAFTNLATIAYNSTTMAWWRIRESGGTTYWDYSSDGYTWTNLFSVANLLAMTAMTVVLQVFDGSSDAAPGNAKMVNLNALAPSVTLDSPADAGTVVTVTPQLAFTGTDANIEDITYEIQVDTANTFTSLATFADNFDNNTLSGSWTQSGTGTVAITNQEAEITTGGASGNYKYLLTTGTINLTGSAVQARLVSIGSGAANTDCIAINAQVDGNNTLFISINGGNIQCLKKVATVQAQVGSNVTYNSAVHKYFRIRESSGTTFWDYSTDGYTWINLTSIANPLTVTALNVGFGAGQFGVVAATTMKFDDFIVGSTIMLVDKISLSDVGFTDITNGADTNPFASGNQIGYTLQTSLSNGVTYYWKARGKATSGTNLYGSFPTAKSFTVSTGGVILNLLMLTGVGV